MDEDGGQDKASGPCHGTIVYRSLDVAEGAACRFVLPCVVTQACTRPASPADQSAECRPIEGYAHRIETTDHGTIDGKPAPCLVTALGPLWADDEDEAGV